MSESEYDNFGEWMSALLGNPFACGAKGVFFYIAALPTMIICGVLGLQVFPPGRYPQILLIAPGLVLGCIVLYVFALLVYKMPAFMAVGLSLAISVVAYYWAYILGSWIVRQLMDAF